MMKKILLTLSLILCISILLPILAGCNTADPLSNLEGFSICGNDVSKYKIVYASSDPEAAKWENYYFGVDYKYDEISANELKSQIKSIFDIELEVTCDAESEPSEYEILVGKTNREASRELNLFSLLSNERKCQVMNNKLVLCGGDYSSTYHCIDLLVDEFNRQAEAGSKVVYLDSSFKCESSFDVTNIALIGDDVFSQSTITDTDILNVPSVMQRLLWKDYNVHSYLADDCTVKSELKQGKQFIATDAYKDLVANCNSLDAVVINLGTYDLKYSEISWNKTDDAIFVSSYQNIIEELHSNNKDIKFYICTTVNAKDNQDIINAQKSVYKALVDLNYDVTLVDLDTLIGKYFYDESFVNGFYPKEYASAVIAKKIASAIEE